jgi:hypothetical protein
MILTGTQVKVTFPSVRSSGVVVKSRLQEGSNDREYLIEFPDERRSWYHYNWVEMVLPKPQEYGIMEVYEDIEVYETEDWTTIKVDGKIVHDGHNIDGAELLYVLDIKHNYLYLADPAMFRLCVEGTGA